MNIYIREMKSHLKSLIAWCISVFLLIVLGMVKYGGFSKTGESINELMQGIPDGLKAVFGLGFFNLTEVKGYYGVFFSYFLLMAVIHACITGATIIAKEERDKTAEFLFAKPASRNKIITSKLLAAFTNILVFNIITLVSSVIIVGMYNKGDSINKDIILLMIAMFILQLLFMSIGTAIAAVNSNPKKSVSISTSILLFTYMLSIVINMNSKIENLKYITPFKYFESKYIMLNEGFDTTFVILSVIIIIVSLSITHIFYRKRDLNV